MGMKIGLALPLWLFRRFDQSKLGIEKNAGILTSLTLHLNGHHHHPDDHHHGGDVGVLDESRMAIYFIGAFLVFLNSF